MAEVAFGIKGSGAALTGGRDCLAVGAVGDIAGSENTGEVGLCALALEQVAVGVRVELADKRFCVGGVSNRNKHALQVELRGFASDQVFDLHGGHFAFRVGEVFLDGRVPDGLDFGICERAIGHDF